MEILVKKNNELFSLGEGKIFSKRQLRLNEDETTVTSTATTTPSQGLTDGIKQLNNSPQADAYENTVGSMDGNTKDDGTVLTMGYNKAQTADGKRDANNFIRMSQSSPNGDQNKIRIVKNNSQNSLGESRIIEMRKNSIPFTKKELHNFLKSI